MKQPRVIKVIAYSLICVFLVGVALYYIPWPTRVNMVFNCRCLSVDGGETDIGKVTVRGWKFDYLFQNERIDVDISFPETYGWLQPENHGDTFVDDYLWTSDCRYLVTMTTLMSSNNASELCSARYAISIKDGYFILYNESKPDAPYLVGSVEVEYKATDIFEYFAVFVDTRSQ